MSILRRPTHNFTLQVSFELSILKIFYFRYGLITEVQVSQSDVVELESKYNVSVLRIRHQKGLNKQSANSSSSNSNSQQQQQSNINSMTNNENALILNLICDSLYNHSVVNEQRNINTVLI